jgi:integrase
MPKVALTDRFVTHVKPGQAQAEYFDAKTKGLALRVSSGAKSWAYHFTWNGKRARFALGSFPATSLATARTKALQAKADVEAGTDPRLRASDTLTAVVARYTARRADLRTINDRAGVLNRLVLPKLGPRPIGTITRADIVGLLDAIEDENGPVAADQTLAFLRVVMNWHAVRSDEFRSPIVRGMARTKPRERARQRKLTDDELRTVWQASADQGVFGAMLRFILLTATRRNEAARMVRAEVVGAEWTIPAARHKSKRAFLLPLSGAALAAMPDTAPFVFSSDGGKTGLGGFSKAKRHFDKRVPLPNWTIHDLRRTARSLMSRAGVDPDHAERALGHVIAGVRGVYDVHEFHEEKARAFEALARQIDRIVNPQPNVVAMRGAER